MPRRCKLANRHSALEMVGERKITRFCTPCWGRLSTAHDQTMINTFDSSVERRTCLSWTRLSLRCLSDLTAPRKTLSRLANSHAAGVLHNDVASRNALLSMTHNGGRGLLCDFGISRVLRGGVEAASLIDTELDGNKWPVLQMPRESLEHPFPLTAESDSWMYGLFLYEVGRERVTACAKVCPAADSWLDDRMLSVQKARPQELLFCWLRLQDLYGSQCWCPREYKRFGFKICRRSPDLPPGDVMW